MSTVSLTLDEIFDLAKKTLLANGCDDETASILSDLIRNAERDGSLSHGLFRLPAYVSGCLLYTSPSPRDGTSSRMPSSA